MDREQENQKELQNQENDNQDGIEPEATEDQSIELEDLKLKFDELKNEYLRTHADFENVKRRLEREKFQSLEYAYEKFVIDLLPVIDALEKALEASQGQEAISQGIELTLDSLLKILSKHGVVKIDTSGEFNPNIHECIMQVENDQKNDGEIDRTLQHGYLYKERTIRPAMVSVVKN